MGFARSILALTALGIIAGAQASGGWLTNWQQAVKQAKAQNKLILANFTGSDWCAPCKVLHKEVFDTPEFKAWAKKNAILMIVDFPQGKKQSKQEAKQSEALADRYGVRGFPDIRFIDANGRQIARATYLPGGAKAWIKKAEEVIAQGRAQWKEQDKKKGKGAP